MEDIERVEVIEFAEPTVGAVLGRSAFLKLTWTP